VNMFTAHSSNLGFPCWYQYGTLIVDQYIPSSHPVTGWGIRYTPRNLRQVYSQSERIPTLEQRNRLADLDISVQSDTQHDIRILIYLSSLS
jgi:hypothetical protein